MHIYIFLTDLKHLFFHFNQQQTEKSTVNSFFMEQNLLRVGGTGILWHPLCHLLDSILTDLLKLYLHLQIVSF